MSKGSNRRPRSAHSPTITSPCQNDAHLSALLLFLGDYAANAQVDSTFLESIKAARRFLATPIADKRSNPGIYEAVMDMALATYREMSDAYGRDHAEVLRTIRAGTAIGLDEVCAEEASDLLFTCIHKAALIGACCMYELLKGDAR